MIGWLKGLDAAGRIILLVAVALLLVLLWQGLQRLNPFSAERRLEKVEAEAEHAVADGEARALEVKGEREIAAQVENYHSGVAAYGAALDYANQESRSAPDADEPLDPAAAARYHAADRRLCELRPTLAGCPAPADAP